MSFRIVEVDNDGFKVYDSGGTLIDPAEDSSVQSVLSALEDIRDTDGIKKIIDALPAGTNEIGKVAQGTKAAANAAWPIYLVDSSGNILGVVLDGSVYRLQVQAKIARASDGTYINPATEDTLDAIKDTDGIKKITDALPAGTNEIGKVSQGTKASASAAWPIAPYDSSGNALSIAEETTVVAAQPGFLIAGKRILDSKTHFLTLNDLECLRTNVVSSVDDPVYTILTQGKRSYYSNLLINAATPALIESTTESYNIGGTTLTIAINGTTQYAAFNTRAATAGIHYSGPDPATANGAQRKFKLSVDGGAIKEVTIATNLTSGDAIAAALQTAIRTLVENGSGVTVQYNTEAFPFRYVITSGTTGSTSKITVYDSGDNLDLILKCNGYGGTSIDGLAANYYWASETAEILVVALTNVLISATTKVKIQTVSSGTSATLQVSAGGANTALQFPTSLVTGANGSGSSNMNVNGSTTNVRFEVPVPTGYTYYVTKLQLRIRDDAAAMNKFGGVTALTNGVLLQFKNLEFPIIDLHTFTTNGGLLSRANSGGLTANAYPSGGTDIVYAWFDFGAGLRLQAGTDSNLYITVRDNLTGLNEFIARVEGLIES